MQMYRVVHQIKSGNYYMYAFKICIRTTAPLNRAHSVKGM